MNETFLSRSSVRKLLLGAFGIFCVFLVSGCGIQSIPESRNAVEASQAEIINQYKRRSDLIPNLVNTVKGYAKQEAEVLEKVTEARAKATATNIVTNDPNSIRKFQQTQGELGAALSRLMMITENYPQLKSDANFRELQAQLEGTENRITIARQRHIENIKIFNDRVSVPPSSFTNMIIYHYEKMPQWTVDNAQQIQEAPKVNF